MKRYIAKCNKVVTCIYGTRQLVEGLEVPEIFARRFPQYVNCIETIDPTPIDVIQQIKETIDVIQQIKETIEAKSTKKKDTK